MASQLAETHLLKAAVNCSNIWMHLPKNVLAAQLCQQIRARKHLACRAVWVMVEAQDVHNAVCAVWPRVLC
jgi:hypothetical protein